MCVAIIMFMFMFCSVFSEPIESARGFDFLSLNTDARSAALGGISTISDQAGTFFMGNPALVAGTKTFSGLFSFQSIALDMHTGSLAAAYRLASGVVVAPNISYISFGSLAAIDENANSLGVSLSPYGFSAGVSVGYQWYNIFYTGATVKYVHEYIASAEYARWDEAKASAMLVDLGFYLSHRLFRFAGGVRNLGGTWDSYENYDAVAPTSVFASFGVIIQGDTRLNWYLEAEQFIHDYLFFRTGLELPVYRDIVTVRAGTNFTTDDIRQLFSVFGGNASEGWEYSARNWSVAGFGATVNVPFRSKQVFVDFAFQLRRDGIEPGLSFSGGVLF